MWEQFQSGAKGFISGIFEEQPAVPGRGGRPDREGANPRDGFVHKLARAVRKRLVALAHLQTGPCLQTQKVRLGYLNII